MNLRRIPLLLYLLAVVGFGIFGAIHRQSYPDITTQPDYLNQLSVAVLPDEACAMASQDMLERFPRTPIIARVTPISDLIPLFYVNQQKFRVQQVFSGEELSVGEEIWITDPSWCVLVKIGGRRRLVGHPCVSVVRPGNDLPSLLLPGLGHPCGHSPQRPIGQLGAIF